MVSMHSTAATHPFQHPFYFGGTAGAGSTTWEGLVPTEQNQNGALVMSTPIEVEEGGGVFGSFIGYEVNPYFAVEAAYTHYPSANVRFDQLSLFSFNNNFEEEYTTRTETVSVMGKIMLVIPNTNIRAYSSAGVADLHRKDMLLDDWRLSPTFSLGLNYNFTPRIMGEIGANYTAGFGESALEPCDTYFPFLYSGFIRLAFRLG